jgi:hypothetical protein
LAFSSGKQIVLEEPAKLTVYSKLKVIVGHEGGTFPDDDLRGSYQGAPKHTAAGARRAYNASYSSACMEMEFRGVAMLQMRLRLFFRFSEATGSGTGKKWNAVVRYWRAQFDPKLLAARKFNHVLVTPEESRPILFQALSSLNRPELVNESVNSSRAK